LVPSSYERRFYFGKDRLVMPLDMAKMLNLKNANVYNTYYFLFLSAITLATAFLTIFKKPIHSALTL
jgi:hypothetical protein